MKETLGMIGTLPERLRMMPSGLNDACRTMEAAAVEIERLRGVLSGFADDFEIAANKASHMAEAQRLTNCSNTIRASINPVSNGMHK